MRGYGIGLDRMRDAGAAGVREGFQRLARAAEALSSSGVADAAATVSISEDARRLGARASESDVLDATLELQRASLLVSTGVTVLLSADDMNREALEIAGRRRA